MFKDLTFKNGEKKNPMSILYFPYYCLNISFMNWLEMTSHWKINLIFNDRLHFIILLLSQKHSTYLFCLAIYQQF